MKDAIMAFASIASASPMHLLVADDDVVVQRLIIMHLHSLGHAGVVVGDGVQALACLRQRVFDIVMLDVMMPALDGLATLAAIRRAEAATPGQPRQRVIMVTAHCDSRDIDRLIAAGADGHIAKPLNTAQFKSELARVQQTY
jgi:CheY-like chemotaxis protein